MHKTTEFSFTEALARTVFLSGFTLLCFYSALWMLQDIFPDWQISRSAEIWMCVLAVLTAAADKIVIRILPGRMLQWGCRTAVVLLYGEIFYTYIRERQIDFEDGSCALAVQYVEKFNYYMKTSFYIWKGKTELLGMAFAVWALLAVLALLILALYTGKRAFLLALPALALAALLSVGYSPGWKGTAAFFAALLFTFAGEEDGKKYALRVHARGVRRGQIRLQLLRLLPGLCLAVISMAVLATGSILFKDHAGRLMMNAPKVKEFQKDAEQKARGIVSGFFLQQREDISNQPPHYTGKEVIKITASKAPSADIYLRGFYGTDYENGSWVCKKQAFADVCAREGFTQEQAAGELLQAEYDTLMKSMAGARLYISSSAGQQGMPDESAGYTRNVGVIDYVLDYTGISDRYAYLPYFTNPLPDRDESSLSGDVLVQKARSRKTFAVTGWDGQLGMENIAFIGTVKRNSRESVFGWYDSFAENAYLAVSDRVPAVADYLWTESYRSELVEEQLGITAGKGESYYIPALIKDIEEKMTEGDRDVVHLQMRLATAWLVSRLMHDRLSYSLNTKPLPAGRDAVDYFLAESHEGFCIHFASAAALILRRYGIPARYVSGYVARREEFKGSDGSYVASVKDHDAHAWVEIYLDGIGWAPVEVTPAAGRQQTDTGNTNQTDTQPDSRADDTQADDTQTEDSQADDTQPDDTLAEEEQPEEPQHTGGEGRAEDGWDSLLPVLRAIAVTAVFMVCVLFIYCLVRSRIRSYQNILKKELQNGRYRKAVVRLNHRIYRRMRIKGKIRKKDMTDAEYGQALQSVYPEVSREDWERYMQVVKAAAFSEGELEAEDAYFCYDIYQKLHMKLA